jgi:hypothetical protein
VLLAGLLGACRVPTRRCWTPRDQSPGWKQAALPAEAPALAAPPDVDQYRADEPALAWQEEGADATRWNSLGSADFALDVEGRHADAVELTFDARLGGAVVEARNLTAGGSYVVLSRTRRHEPTVRLELADPATTRVVVTVHHHLRAEPRLVSWRSGRWQRPSGTAPALVYRQPEGRSIELCDRPEQTPTFHPAWQTDPPRLVSLERTLLSRAQRFVWR